jgi:hypothetical protein
LLSNFEFGGEVHDGQGGIFAAEGDFQPQAPARSNEMNGGITGTVAGMSY